MQGPLNLGVVYEYPFDYPLTVHDILFLQKVANQMFKEFPFHTLYYVLTYLTQKPCYLYFYIPYTAKPIGLLMFHSWTPLELYYELNYQNKGWIMS